MSHSDLGRSLRVVVIALALVIATRTARAEAKHWRVRTDRGPVHVFTPSNYDRVNAQTVVFVHGYNIDVDNAWTEYHLQEQFERSGLNAMFIACSAPSSLREGVAWASLPSLLRAVVDGIAQPLPEGEIIAVGHSAAYRTLVLWLTNPAVRTLVLLDAAYGEEDQFMAWTRDDQTHRLINIASDTIQESNWIHMFLPSTKRVYGLPADWTDDTRSARVLYVRTNVGHMPMITDGVALPLALRALAEK
ncbi:MAG TPA: hypothetical protein VFQ65_18365 [Kofleriaceae bacterium]|nr:hypothetical protein [Kofleriaceae bacterium]